MSKRIQLTIANIRAAATDAGNRYMRDHPNERPDGAAAWTRNALDAATEEFHRLCRAAGAPPDYVAFLLTPDHRVLGPVEKRGGHWGWFEERDHCLPRFVAYGSVTTKRDAIARRLLQALREG